MWNLRRGNVSCGASPPPLNGAIWGLKAHSPQRSEENSIGTSKRNHPLWNASELSCILIISPFPHDDKFTFTPPLLWTNIILIKAGPVFFRVSEWLMDGNKKQNADTSWNGYNAIHVGCCKTKMGNNWPSEQVKASCNIFQLLLRICDMRQCVNSASGSSACIKILLIFSFYGLPHNSLESADQVRSSQKRKSSYFRLCFKKRFCWPLVQRAELRPPPLKRSYQPHPLLWEHGLYIS